MRVLIATGPVGAVGSDRAASLLANAFAAEGAQVAVVPLDDPVSTARTTHEFVAALSAGCAVVDVRGFSWDWADTERLREVLDGVAPVTLVVDDGDVDVPLTGLGGAAVRSSRNRGEDLAAGLAADAEAARWLAEQGIADGPGAGAAHGLGALVISHGGGVTSAIEHQVARTGIARTAAQADLLVTGCTSLDFHARGGPVVARMVALGEETLRPVIVVTGHNFVSARELRLAGIEAAYAVHPGAEGETDEASLGSLAARVARTWRQ